MKRASEDMTTLFISGIDTDIGKTYACGALAKSLFAMGFSLYTQKLVETGCDGISKDLLMHEKIVGKKFNKSDVNLHCPYRFLTPVSPHLSAQIDGKVVDTAYLGQQMINLAAQCQHLLVEGAGGLCVPLNDDELLVDFVVNHRLPVVLVTSARLGSINHTLLSLELCRAKNIDVRAIIYNHYPKVSVRMLEDTRKTIKKFVGEFFEATLWFDLLEGSDLISFDEKEAKILLG